VGEKNEQEKSSGLDKKNKMCDIFYKKDPFDV
jgi:hypothetical protein